MTVSGNVSILSANTASMSMAGGLWRGFWWQGVSLAVMNHA